MLVESKNIENYFYDNLFLDSGFVVKEIKQLRVIVGNRIIEPFAYNLDGDVSLNEEIVYQEVLAQYVAKKSSQFMAFTNRLHHFCSKHKNHRQQNIGLLLQSFVSKLNISVGYLDFDESSIIPNFFDDYVQELSDIRFEIQMSLESLNRIFIELIDMVKSWRSSLIDDFKDYHKEKIDENYNDIDPNFTSEEYSKVVNQVTTRLALLYEIGIIQFLKEKYSSVSHRKMAFLLSHIIGKNDNSEQVRRVYGTIDSTDYSNLKNNPFKSEKTSDEVNRLMEEFLNS